MQSWCQSSRRTNEVLHTVNEEDYFCKSYIATRNRGYTFNYTRTEHGQTQTKHSGKNLSDYSKQATLVPCDNCSLFIILPST